MKNNLPANTTINVNFSMSRRWIHRRDLLYELVITGVKTRYKRSALGLLWALLNPLAHLLIFIFIRGALRIDVPNYPLFLFTGILVWNWFREGISQSVNSITGNRDLIKRPGFPLALLPVVAVITPLLDMLIGTPILIIIWLNSNVQLGLSLVALPLVIAIQFILVLGIGYLLATVNVRFRDTQQLTRVGLRLFFFLTPIFYDGRRIPEALQPLYNLNPLLHLLNAYRAILMDGVWPEWQPLLLVGLGGLLFMWLARRFFIRGSYRFVEEL